MATPQLPTGSGELHEREREIALLEQALIDGKAAESRLVLIEGQAGIGKSRLLLEMRRMAEAAGFAVVVARGFEFERDYAFGMLRQLIGNAQRDVSDGEVRSNADAAPRRARPRTLSRSSRVVTGRRCAPQRRCRF
jgi:predicted ATPase